MPASTLIAVALGLCSAAAPPAPGTEMVASPSTDTATSSGEQITVWGKRSPGRLHPTPDRRFDLEDRPERQESLGDVLEESPGAVVIRRGGVGATEQLSLRGADFDHTAVLIDDIPIVGPDRGAVDLSLLPLSGFAELEVHRGSAPIRYGAGAIGGVVRLVPGEVGDHALRFTERVGTFGLLGMAAEGETYRGDLELMGSATYLRAENDFPYRFDVELFDPSDDEIRIRENAQVEQGSAFVLGRWSSGGHRVTGLGLMVHQARGLPGPAMAFCRDCRQQRTRAFGSVGWRFEGTLAGLGLAAFATAGVGLDADRVQDPLGRIGLEDEDVDDRYLSVDGRAGAFLELLSGWWLGAVLAHRFDRAEPLNRLDDIRTLDSSRHTTLVAAESTVQWAPGGRPLRLEASTSAQLSEARIRSETVTGPLDRGLERTGLNHRAAARFRPWDPLELFAQFATGYRLPTALELFGNRNTVVGNPELEPETSVTAELGIALDVRRGDWRLDAELRGFWLEVRDLIVALRTAQNTVAFENRRVGRTLGLETGVGISFGRHLRASFALTYLDPQFDYRGRDRLQPLRPPWRWFSRLRSEIPLVGGFERVEAFAEVDHRSSFFTDSANLVVQAPYTTVDLGAELVVTGEGLRVFGSVRNVFDELGLDLLAFPRPGRSFEVGLALRTGF